MRNRSPCGRSTILIVKKKAREQKKTNQALLQLDREGKCGEKDERKTEKKADTLGPPE